MDYAIIKLGNKQHRVRDGETLVVDRLRTEAGQSFEPVVLLGEGTVTATVIAHERGPKILIGKYRKRTGYKRHNGFRAATSRVEISLGAGGAERTQAAKPAAAAPEPTRPAAPLPGVPDAEHPADAAPDAAAPDAAASDAAAPDAAASEAASPEAAAPEATAVAETTLGAVTGALPAGYEGMTVSQVVAAAREWTRAEVEAALAYEHEHAARKGALAALELMAAKEDR